MAGGVADWKPLEFAVQRNLRDGEFLNASFALLAAGPPRLAQLGIPLNAQPGAAAKGLAEIARPIGLVQNFAISHNRSYSRIFEIGSDRSMWIPGRGVGQATLGRVLYHSWSLLRVLYSWYDDQAPPHKIDQLFPFETAGVASIVPHNVKVPAGYDNFFINLASDLFTQPIGLLFIIQDNNEKGYASFYLESCQIPNHSLATDAQGLIFQESAAIQFERALAVKVSGAELTGAIIDGLNAVAA
jgi:hypothetical protein